MVAQVLVLAVSLLEDREGKMNPLEILKFVQGQVNGGSEQLHALAALADAPGEDFQPTMRLPVQNPIPAFRLGDSGLGSLLANLDYGVPAPVLGQEIVRTPDIGQLLVGEHDAAS